MEIKRGDVYLAKLDDGVGSEQTGERPVLIIQNDMGNLYSPTTIVAAITTSKSKKALPTHVELPSDKTDLPENSIVMLEQIYTIDKIRLKRFVCHLNDAYIALINNAIRCSIGLDIGNKTALCFRSDLHKRIFVGQLKNTSHHCSNKHLAVLYLLTAESDLWLKVKDKITDSEIRLHEVDKRGVSALGYVLLDIASDIMNGTTNLSIKDMSDTFLFFNRTFLIMMEAIRISRYGYKALNFTN